jgi:predicted dehydrogenase
MSKKEIRIGIIGCGIISNPHVKHYQGMPDVKVVAVCDVIEKKAKDFAERYNIDTYYTDYRDLLARDDIDAVDVNVHNNLHAPLSIAVMRAGKHCYCEKPIAGTYTDAKAMLRASEQTGKKLHIQLARLYTDGTHAAKKFIEDGRLGKLYHSRSYGYRRRGRPFVDGYAEKEFNSKYWAAGGALYDMGVYNISRMLYLLGLPKVARISGSVYQEVPMHEDRRKEGGFDVEEFGAGFVKFEDKSSLDILESWAIHAGDFPNSMICGSLGGLSINESAVTFYSEMSGYPVTTTLDIANEKYRTHQIDSSLNSLDHSQAHWVAALRGELEMIPTAQIALQTMLISEGIFMSSEQGCEVSADDVDMKSVSQAITRQDTDFGVLEYIF